MMTGVNKCHGITVTDENLHLEDRIRYLRVEQVSTRGDLERVVTDTYTSSRHHVDKQLSSASHTTPHPRMSCEQRRQSPSISLFAAAIT